MQTNYEAEQLSIYDLDSWCGRTFPEPSPAEHQKEKTFGVSSRRSSELRSVVFQSLDLTPGAGNLLGQFEWEMRSALHGGAFLRNTGPSPRDATESCLSQILEDHPPKKYYLTTAACLGILRRAKERGKPLPKALDTALRIQAGLIGLPEGREKTVPFDDSAVLAQPGMRQQNLPRLFPLAPARRLEPSATQRKSPQHSRAVQAATVCRLLCACTIRVDNRWMCVKI